MVIAFEVVIILISITNLLNVVKNYKRFHCIYPIIAVFDLVMVVPILLELILGIPDIPRDVYMNFVRAMEEQTTLVIYCVFVFAAQVAFFHELKRIKIVDRNLNKNNGIQDFLLFVQKNKYKNVVMMACGIIIVINIIAIVLSPNLLYYLTLRSVHLQTSVQIVQYTKSIVNPLLNLLIGAIILLKIFDLRNKIESVILRGLLVIFYTLVNGKRTYLMIIVGVFFLIDLLREGSLRKIAPKYIILFGLVVIYFYEYMYITDKISYNSDWYYEMQEYIFRSMHVRFSIYAALHPKQIHVLDYLGQSILFSLFFFIPRSLWTSKPWPYIDYYMRAVLNLSSLSYVTYHMLASYYPEFVSNFGLLGLPLSIFFTIWISRYFDKRKTHCKLLGIALISLLNIYYYNDLLKVVAVIVLYMCITEKHKIVIRR